MAGASNTDVGVIVGVDGSGRTHRLDQVAEGSGRPVIRVNAPILDLDRLAEDLAGGGDAIVLVDDAHRLEPSEVAVLAAAARRGASVVISRRPTLPSRAHADLDEAVGGRVEQLAPLEVGDVGAIVAARRGRPVGPDEAVALHAASGGLPAIAVVLAHAAPGQPEPSLVARIQRRLAQLEPPVAALARLLALRLDLPDPVLAAASGLDRPDGDLGAGMRELADEGMLIPGTEVMIPAVAEALVADLPAAQRRRVHEAVAQALVAAGADPLSAAIQLRAARAFVPASVAIFVAAGDRSRLTDPAVAVGWYDDAVEAGADPSEVATGRAEAAVLLGQPVDAPVGVPPDQAGRAAMLAGVIEAHHGRSARAGAGLLAAGGVGALLAVPSLIAVGDIAAAQEGARQGVEKPAPNWMHRLAEAALTAATEPARSVPLFIEAVEAFDRTPPAMVLPDTPHGLGALLASAVGDRASAEYLLERAIAAATGGPVFSTRHQILLAWVRMRAGRYDSAVALLGGGLDAAITGRERLLAAALAAGVARRGGDVATLREAWRGVEPALARQAFDLLTAEAVEELAVAATRLRQHARVAPALDALDEIVERLGRPAAWVVTVGWIRVQVAIAAEDAAAAGAAAARIADACRTGSSARQHAQCAAAAQWARVLGGDVDPDAATAVAAELAAVDLPWEGSRLVGQAAIRTSDAAAARRLLERARDLASAEVTGEKGRAESGYGGLSEREVEVARMVLAGDTYKEIGARLFISPKTVEHHVARIRTKVGADTRAELVAALRTVLSAAE